MMTLEDTEVDGTLEETHEQPVVPAQMGINDTGNEGPV